MWCGSRGPLAYKESMNELCLAGQSFMRCASRGPLAYKEFMHELPDDITPEEAQKEFQAYLIRWWGSQVGSTPPSHFYSQPHNSGN